MIGEHERQAGYLSAYRELQRRVAADLESKRGHIRPARTLWAYYDSAKVQIKRAAVRLMRTA